MVPDEDDRPPVADAGPDRVVQPQDSVTLDGIQSKDDIKIVSYQWHMVSGNPFAVMTVREEIVMRTWIMSYRFCH